MGNNAKPEFSDFYGSHFGDTYGVVIDLDLSRNYERSRETRRVLLTGTCNVLIQNPSGLSSYFKPQVVNLKGLSWAKVISC
jgi:hypothetical protein